VDIGATEFIHRQIMKARSEGKAVLLVSADLDELLALSDRIGVIFKGKIVREFSHETAVREEVGLAMTGGKADVPA
jgi:simple sugar transport system ATP-binding protein